MTSTKNDVKIGYSITPQTSVDWITYNDSQSSFTTAYTVAADNQPRSGAEINASVSSVNGTVKSVGGEVEFDSFKFTFKNANRGPVSYNYAQNDSGKKTTLNITQTGGDGEDSYTFETSESWLSVSDGKVIAEAIPTGTSERSGVVTIKSKTDPSVVITATVSQVPKVFTFIVDASPLEFTSIGGTTNASITSTVDTDGVVTDAPYSNPSETYDWITASHSTKSSTYTIAEDSTERSGATITSGSDYTIEKGSAEDTVDMSGISFTYQNSDRTASLTYKQTESGGLTKSITIKQSGGSGNSTNYTIGSPSASWITVSSNTVKIAKNETGSERSGTVVATSTTDSSKKVTITITQKAEDIEFSVTPSSNEFTVGGGSKSSTVSSKINGTNVAYTIDNPTEYSWLTVSDSNNVTTFTASANNVYKSGTTTVTAASSLTKSVESAGDTIDLSSTTLFTGSNPKNEATIKYTQSGGKATATFTATQPASSVDVNNYTLSKKDSSASWISVSGKSISVAKNDNTSDRSTIIVATNANDSTKTVEITVSQSVAKPSTPTTTKYQNFTFEFDGGGYELVDLGLSSGTKWAKTNLGAENEYDYGDYYMWGSIVPDSDGYCAWSTSPLNNGSSSFDSTYFNSIKDTVCPDGVLSSEYDAAYVTTDGELQMPTQEQVQELIDESDITWYDSGNKDFNGISGTKFANKTDSSKYIFIPASGYRKDTKIYFQTDNGYVWSSSLYPNLDHAWSLYFNRETTTTFQYLNHCNGLNIRPIEYQKDSSLTKVTYTDGHIEYYDITYEIVGDASTSAATEQIKNIDDAVSVIIGNSIIRIGNYAFNQCENLKSITIPNSVTKIDDAAFAWTGIEQLTIPNSVERISPYICEGCQSLKSITLSNIMTEIHASAFGNCTSLTNVTIPDSVTSIDGAAFGNCTGLTSIIIPNSVTSIGEYAFEDCTSLSTITYNGTKAQWNKISKGTDWHREVPSTTLVTCTDGTVALD